MIRRGLTAIELAVVLSVALVVSAMVVPSTLGVLRKSAVRDGASAVVDVWRQARTRAQAEAPDPTDPAPAHYGVVLCQRDGRAWVALIHDDLDAANLIADPEGAAMYRAADGTIGSDRTAQPVLRHRLPESVVVAVEDATGTWRVRDGVWAWYAQYRTGIPIDPAAVAAGTAMLAGPYGIGVEEPPEIAADPTLSAPVLCPGLRIQTRDYDGERGYAAAVAIYHAGIAFMGEPE